MQYFITLLEGIISFLSPCMLPLLPVYLSYFAGGTSSAGETDPANETQKKRRALPRALAFVAGFTLIFTLLGLFAGTLGAFLREYQTVVNIVCGIIVILFGLSYMEIIPLPFFRGMKAGREIRSVFSAFLFGVIYSVSLTPCVGAFLGSALMLASTSGGAAKGALLLLVYSLGLGLPFVLSALLLEKLNTAFQFIKRHGRIINLVCGGFLILVGIAMAFGWLNILLSVFS